MKISAVIISKNEQNLIGACIKSVQFADEILLIDSKSTDNTVKIAKKLGAAIIINPFKNYANQRTFALRQAKGDWILYIDADERVTCELKKELLKVTNNSTFSAYRIPRKNYYLGNNPWPKIEYIERLFLKKNLTKWEGKVHEHAVFDGKAGQLDNNLLHFTHRDLSSMVEKTNTWGDVEAQLLFESNHPPMNTLRFIRIMITKFVNSYIRQSGWRAGTVGLIESIYQSYSYFIIYAKLWEKQNKVKS